MNYADNKDRKFNLMAASGVAGGTSLGWLAPILLTHKMGKRRELLANIKKIRSDNAIDRMLNSLDKRVLKSKTKYKTISPQKANEIKKMITDRIENMAKNLSMVRNSYQGLKSSVIGRVLNRLVSRIK